MGILQSEGIVGLLDASQRSQTVIANNLANINTPGYKAMRLRFAQQLDSILDGTGNPRPGAEIETEVFQPGFAPEGLDGNTVNLEREIVELNKSALQSRLYLAVLSSKIRRLRTAMNAT